MVVIESCGLPSPNPSLDLGFPSPVDEKVFDRAFQRVFEDRARFDKALEAGALDNPLPTPNSDACFSSDEAEVGSDRDRHAHEERDEYPFPSQEFSLFYPDTAPRDNWRPQVETWIRRNHSYKLADRASKPYAVPKKSASVKSFAAASQQGLATPKKHKAELADDGLRSPSRSESPSPASKAASPSLQSNHTGRRCISCGSDQSPCWRPSWSIEAGQLCNSCGLRYKKTGARCLSASCGRIPAKGEWMTMRSTQSAGRYSCLYCGGGVAIGENSKR